MISIEVTKKDFEEADARLAAGERITQANPICVAIGRQTRFSFAIIGQEIVLSGHDDIRFPLPHRARIAIRDWEDAGIIAYNFTFDLG